MKNFPLSTDQNQNRVLARDKVKVVDKAEGSTEKEEIVSSECFVMMINNVKIM